MSSVQRLLTVQVLVEDDEETINRTVNYIKTSLKGSCRNLNNGAVVLGLYDEDDSLVGLDITGRPSDVMQKMADDLFAEDTYINNKEK